MTRKRKNMPLLAVIRLLPLLGKSTAYGSIAYMKDLLGDLAPDRYKKYLPKELSK